jgi:hypothetical protein
MCTETIMPLKIGTSTGPPVPPIALCAGRPRRLTGVAGRGCQELSAAVAEDFAEVGVEQESKRDDVERGSAAPQGKFCNHYWFR